jgi:hypothetical protein
MVVAVVSGGVLIESLNFIWVEDCCWLGLN